jgi:hypothetical protein
MLNRAAFSLRGLRVMNSDDPFGETPVVMLGDFRKTCPVIPGGRETKS